MRSSRPLRILLVALPAVVAMAYQGLAAAQGPGHTISGILTESPGCMGAERGWTVALDPGFITTTTSLNDGSFSFSNVSDGSYTVYPLPPCNPFGCWNALPVTVAGSDRTGLQICLQGPLPTPTPVPPYTPAPTPTGPAPTPPPTPQTPIPGGPDLAVTISGPPPLFTPIAPDDPLNFVVSVWNLGDAAASPVEVVDPDVGFSPVAVQSTQGSCALFYNGSYGVRLFCDLGTLDPPGGPGESSAAIVLSGPAPDTGRAPGLGVIRTNTVTVDPGSKVAESNESNNTASVDYFLVVPLPTPTPTYTQIPATPTITPTPDTGAAGDPPVGGIAEAPEDFGATHGGGGLPVGEIAMLAGIAVVAATAGGWYARRRFGRQRR